MPTTGAHALLIEDEMMIALELEYLLSERGYRTFDVAMSPAEALACAKARKPDLITADYRILEGTGIEAVAAVQDAMGPVPVVFVTGNYDLVIAETSAPVVEKPVTACALAWASRYREPLFPSSPATLSGVLARGGAFMLININ